MGKILLALNAVDPDIPALDFGCYLANLTHSKITGVFLENIVASQKLVFKKGYGVPYVNWEIDDTSPGNFHRRELTDINIQYFRQSCENRSTPCNVHRDRGTPANELVMESRYADFIVVDAATSFARVYDGMPTKFVKDVLNDAECPVILAPHAFEGIDEIVFLYDNSKSAAYAMKQFTYLLPQFDDKKITLVQANKEGQWKDGDKYNLREWLQNHYSSIGFEVLKGDPDDRLLDYVFKRKNAFIVMGAYGRTAFSRLFNPSQADVLIKALNQPIFITHC